MAKQFIEDGEKGFIVRKKINENFSELYSNDTLWLSGKNLSLNSLTKYGNANTLLNSIVYDTGSNVGIGTSFPSDKLHVVGGNIVGYSGNLSTYTGLVVRNRSSVDYTIDGRIIVDTVNTPNKVIIGSTTNHPLQIITNNTQRVWIDSSGMTTSGNLNVAGDVTITGNLSALGTTTQIDTKMYVTSAVSITNTGSGPALYVKQTGTNDIATFLDDNNTALIVKDGGKVGIGLENPSRTLSINGTPTVNGSNRSILALMDTSPMASDIGGGLDFGGIYNFAGNYAEWAGIKGIKENAVNGDFAASLVLSTRSTSSSTSEKMRITSTGRVGIGTSAPNNTLHVVSTTLFPARLQGSNTNTTALEIYNTASNKIWENAVAGTSNAVSIPSGSYYIYEQGVAPRMVITTSGNLGIGTINPTEKLTVSGNLSASGDATVSGNLSAVGTGTIKTVNSNTTSNDVLVLGPNNIIEKRTLTLWNAGASGLLNNGLTTNYITKYGSTNDLVNSLIYDNGTNIAIGTTSPEPQARLHVKGTTVSDDLSIRIENTSETGYSSITFGSTQSTSIWKNGSLNTGYAGASSLNVGHSTANNVGIVTNNQTRMIITSGGNIGIGTIAPEAKLHIYGSSEVFRISDGTRVIYSGCDSNNPWFGTATNHDLRLTTNALERFRITADGNVGIGVSSPSKKLEIGGISSGVSSTWQGGTDFINLFATNGNFSEQAISFQETGTNIGAKIGVKNTVNGAYDIIFANRASTSTTTPITEKVRITNNGNVGIGTNTPSGKLDVNGTIRSNNEIIGTALGGHGQARYVAGNYGVIHRNDGADYYILKTLSSDQYGGWDTTRSFSINLATGNVNMAYSGTMNVGIGTSSPSTKLHVSTTNTFPVTIENPNLAPSVASNADSFTLFKNYYGNTQISNWQNVGMRIGSRSTANGGTGQIVFTTGNDSEQMRLDASGNLGIGTSSPASKLDVAGTCQVDYLVVDAQDGTNEGGEISLKGAGSYGNLQIDNFQGNLRIHTLGANNAFEIIGGSSSQQALRISTGGVYIAGTSKIVGDVYFNENRTASNNHITINNNLTNYGSISFRTNIPTSPGTEINTSSIRGYTTDNVTGRGDLVFLTKGTDSTSPLEKVRIYDNANVGIGTRLVGVVTNSTYNGLTVGTYGLNNGSFIANRYSSTSWSEWYDFTNGSSFGTNNAKYLSFKTSNAERMRISSGGNVGIGTSNPGRVFHTNGTVRFEGLSTYANNSDAKTAGLIAGDVYKTSTGELRIVF